MKSLTVVFPIAIAIFISPLAGTVAFFGALGIILVFSFELVLGGLLFVLLLAGSFFLFPFEDFLYVAGYLLAVILGWTFWSVRKTIREEDRW